MALEREVQQFKIHLPDLLGLDDANEGKYAVVKGDAIDGPFETYEDALGFGYATYGPTSFLVRKIERHATVMFIARELI